MTFEYSDPRDNIHSECELEVHRLKEEIATLTAERDEARKEVAWQKKKVRNLRLSADAAGRVDLLSQIDSLTSELAALRSCPEMGEVDALIAEMDAMRDTHSSHWMCDQAKRLADIARRAIASHAAEKQRAERGISDD